MIDLIYVRHGQTTWNAQRRLQGQKDSPLSDLGIRQARAVARRLSRRPIDAIYTSDLSRARVTAETINASHHLTIRPLKELREIDLGDWEGRSIAELEEDEAESDLLAKWRNDSFTHRPPGGERLEDLRDRAVSALHAMLRECEQYRRIVAITHGGVIKATVGWVLGLPIDHQRRFEVGNASITRITKGGRGLLLETLNDTSHWSENLTD